MPTSASSTSIQILSLQGAFDPSLAEQTKEALSQVIDLSSHSIELMGPQRVLSRALRDRNCSVLVMPGGNALGQHGFNQEYPLFKETLSRHMATDSFRGVEATCASAYALCNHSTYTCPKLFFKRTY